MRKGVRFWEGTTGIPMSCWLFGKGLVIIMGEG